MSIHRLYVFVVVCTIFGVQTAWAQVANSPFTRFGVGENYSDAVANTQGMAGIGISQPQYWYINNQNPALLIYNSMSSFQVGMLGESQKISDNSKSEKHIGGNLNYLITAFPIKPRKWTTSAGLMPYTSMNYKVQYSQGIEGTNQTSLNNEEGTGGLTQLYWSNGVRIYKDLSLGLKVTYLFGNIDKINKLQPTNTSTSTSLISASEDKTVVKDFTFNAGISYSKDSLVGPYRLSIGAVYGFASNVNATLYNKVSNINTAGDTVSASTLSKTRGSLNVPAFITTGISISKGTKWSLGTEFKYQDWSAFSSVNNINQNLKESWRVALGGEYTPDPLAVEGFFKRMTYRVGVSTEKCPFLVNNNQVKDSGINFGFSFPTGRSSIDLGFKVGKRGNKTENILEQNYFKVYFGITFNDQWFIRRKFD